MPCPTCLIASLVTFPCMICSWTNYCEFCVRSLELSLQSLFCHTPIESKHTKQRFDHSGWQGHVSACLDMATVLIVYVSSLKSGVPSINCFYLRCPLSVWQDSSRGEVNRYQSNKNSTDCGAQGHTFSPLPLLELCLDTAPQAMSYKSFHDDIPSLLQTNLSYKTIYLAWFSISLPCRRCVCLLWMIQAHMQNNTHSSRSFKKSFNSHDEAAAGLQAALMQSFEGSACDSQPWTDISSLNCSRDLMMEVSDTASLFCLSWKCHGRLCTFFIRCSSVCI